MFCLSINHKSADASIRSKLALDSKDREALGKIFRSLENINGIVFLMTCNRNEIYYSGSDEGIYEIIKELAEYKQVPVTEVKKYFMRFGEDATLKHLYHVACGLDSAVLGEVEIIRQIKEAYAESVKLGYSNKEINICFQDALAMAASVAEKSEMTKLPVSVGTLTTEAIIEFECDSDEKTVLIIGASGETGGIVLNNLIDADDKVKIVATARKHNIRLSKQDKYNRVEVIPYDDRYEYLKNADVVVSATKSPHYTLIAEDVKKSFKEDTRKRLFIDLAIPKDVDPDIKLIENLEIKDIDYIKEWAKENNTRKYLEAEKIKLLINDKVDEQRKNFLFREWLENEPEFAELIRDKKMAKIIYKLRDNLDYHTLLKVLNSIKEDEDGIFSIYDSIG